MNTTAKKMTARAAHRQAQRHIRDARQQTPKSKPSFDWYLKEALEQFAIEQPDLVKIKGAKEYFEAVYTNAAFDEVYS